MTGNQSVIEALRSAYEAAPDNMEIALHLASLLLESDQQREALKLFQTVISTEPNSEPALNGALRCAQELEEESLAEAYRHMLTAFGHQSLSASPQKQEPTQPTSEAISLVPKLRVVGGRNEGESQLDLEEPELKLSDVGGMEHVKRRLQLSFLGPLQNPSLMSAYGKSVNGGLLLYGPPGCGKTFIARALAGELGAKFINVGLSDVLDMYLGESERRLHELFENARREAPAVLFFDELDAMGQKRSHLRNSGMRSVVNQLLSEMDSVGSDNTNLFIIGATNHPWDVDAALKRPGRFDRMVAVFPPDAPARRSILEYHLRGKPTSDLNLDRVAELCANFSGADLRHLTDTAVEYVLEGCLESGELQPVAQPDLERAMKEIKPSTKSWFETARNYAFFANEGGSYDELLEYMRKHKL